MEYLWRLALEAPIGVHEEARDQLIKFHQHLAPPLLDDPAAVHRAFLGRAAAAPPPRPCAGTAPGPPAQAVRPQDGGAPHRRAAAGRGTTRLLM